jgi:hypothetical protein
MAREVAYIANDYRGQRCWPVVRRFTSTRTRSLVCDLRATATQKVECMNSLNDGKHVTVTESCATVRKQIEEAER